MRTDRGICHPGRDRADTARAERHEPQGHAEGIQGETRGGEIPEGAESIEGRGGGLRSGLPTPRAARPVREAPVPTPGAAEVPGIAARLHPQPKTNAPVPSPSTSLLALAAVQHQFLVRLLLTSPLPFGAQDPPEHSPPHPRRETSPFTEHQVTTLSLVRSRSCWLWERQTRFRQPCPRSPGYPCPQYREGCGGGSTSAGATPRRGQAHCARLRKRLHSH